MALQKVPVRLYLEYCPGRASPRKRNDRGLQGRSEKKGQERTRGSWPMQCNETNCEERDENPLRQKNKAGE